MATATNDLIEPGLLSLDLYIMHITNDESLNERQLYLRHAREIEHNVVHNVLNSLIDLVDFKQIRKRDEALRRIEKRLEENCFHLNTIADLEIIYRDLHRQKESEEMRKIKDDILQNDEYVKERGICLLEQGYAVLFQFSVDNESICSQNLQDVYRILEAEINYADDKNNMIKKALHYTNYARKALSYAMEFERKEESFERKEISVKKFCRGLECLRAGSYDKDLELVWQFYLGIANNRLDDSLIKTHKPDEYISDRLASATVNAVKIFWQVTQQRENQTFMSAFKIYVARSYAYLGMILTLQRRKSYIEKAGKLNDFMTDKTFQKLYDSPNLAFTMAYDIDPNDSVVLNRLSRSKRLVIGKEIDRSQKFQNLQEAYKLVSKSIENHKIGNWFAYSTRMEICHDLISLDIDIGRENIRHYLKAGREDGLYCYKTTCLIKTITFLVRFCQKLAKFPNIFKYGSEYVQEQHYLHEALIYLNAGVQLGGMTDYFFCSNFSSCLYDVGEYRPAIEWMKRAIYLSKTCSLFPVIQVCLYILMFYNKEKRKNPGQSEYLLAEMIFIIQDARRKFKLADEKWIEELSKIYSKNKFEFIDCLSFLIKRSQSDDFRQQAEIMIKAAIKNAKPDSCKPEIRSLKSELDQMRLKYRERTDSMDADTNMFESFKHMPTEPTERITKEYMYDFFVAYSSHDAGWVHSILLQQLEYKLHDNDIPFRGCVDVRDFEAEKSNIDNIIFAVENSYKIFLVLTPNFIGSNWCDFETDQALTESIGRKGQKDCVVPILLSECDIPKSLKQLTMSILPMIRNHIWKFPN